ncbi:MAG: PD-(D/E)XK motif protein [Candidatus Limnocylindrales bacterium]
MSSIEDLWAIAQEDGPGGGVRVSAEHPADLFASTDATGRRGLLLVTDTEPPARPSLDAVEVTCGLRHDGRWALGIWLTDLTLFPMFTRLCADLVDCTTAAPAGSAAAMLLARLGQWRELLEAGTGPMTLSKLRGLVAELLVIERCLDRWSAADIVAGWAGPLGGPQDLVLPGRRVEVKAATPAARSVHISSVEQLDTAEPLTLAVVTLATLAGGDGIAPNELVERVHRRISEAGPSLGAQFRQRLDALGYLPDPLYSAPMFRLDGTDFYDVAGDFPRLRKASVPAGNEHVTYDLVLASCAPHRSTLAG